MSEDSSTAVLAAVRALTPDFRERKVEAEALRKVPEAGVKALAANGFFRLLQPKRFGSARPAWGPRSATPPGPNAPCCGARPIASPSRCC